MLGIGAGYIERSGEAYLVRATRGRIERSTRSATSSSPPATACRSRVNDVADGRHRRRAADRHRPARTGRRSVVGTALMLIGDNSRTVAAAVDAKMEDDQRDRCRRTSCVKTVLNRTKLVDATISTVEKNLAEGALLVIVVLFLLLGNFRAALITALVIPLSMLMTATGMVQAGSAAT